MPWRDDWPSLPNGTKYDGKNLLKLVRGGEDPFRPTWGVELLIQEIEQKLKTRVIDIPVVDKGSNNYVSCVETWLGRERCQSKAT